MDRQSSESRAVEDSRLERAIVLALLRQDHARRWSWQELGVEIEVDAPRLQEALGRLGADGVVCLGAREAWASAAALRLDELGLIGI